MQQQFRRAIAITAANGHSQHILQRLHYVRGTEQEAQDACRSHHSDNRWRPYQRGGYSWFNSHDRRDMQCLNNSVMDAAIIICPEAVIIDGDLKFESDSCIIFM
jgi:hypothetical protein